MVTGLHCMANVPEKLHDTYVITRVTSVIATVLSPDNYIISLCHQSTLNVCLFQLLW